MNFQALRIEDLPQIQKRLAAAGKLCCDYALSNLFGWSAYYDTRWTIRKGFLLFRFQIVGTEKTAYLEPLGSGDLEQIVEEIQKDAKELKQPLRFFSLSQEFVDSIKTLPATQSLRFYKNRDFGNYIYAKERLALLPGRKLHSKRNHIAQFERKYPQFHFKTISPETDIPSIQKLLDIWTAAQGKSTRTVLEERRMIEACLAHYEALNLFGILLFIGEKPAAFSFGSQINADTFCTHVEKADTRFEGAYAKINQIVACSLPSEIKRINREEDMGLPELRKAKLSYHPDLITEELFAYDTNSEEAKVWQLWQEAFPEDDDSFLVSFLYPYSNENTRMTLYRGDKLASTLHLLKFTGDWGKVAYIYGLATAREFQGKGIATDLIARSLRKAANEGVSVVWAIQANKEFQSWQRLLDFSETQTEPLAFESEDGFPFGEDPDSDFGIFRIVDMKAYLALFMANHPGHAETLRVTDRILPQNSGIYRLEGGSVFKADSQSPADGERPAEILRRFPLPGGKRLRCAEIFPNSKRPTASAS